MTLSDLLAYFESPDFVSKLELASGQRTFLTILGSDAHYLELRERLRRDINAVRKVLSRIKRLTSLSYDQRYANPHDVPLAVFTLALSAIPSYGEVAADFLRSARDIWWASKVIETIARRAEVSPASVIAQKVLVFTPGGVDTRFSTQTNEIHLDFVSALGEINIVPLATVQSINYANSTFSEFLLDPKTIFSANANAAISEVEIQTAEAA